MKPHENLRKILGLYEHELNSWLEAVLRRVDQVIDVGANDGYFTFGCAAAFHRLGKQGRVLAFEPQPVHYRQLQASAQAQPAEYKTDVKIEQKFVGNDTNGNCFSLDQLSGDTSGTLLKIDVEGGELDVIAGATRWVSPQNHFLIEVHREEYLRMLVTRFSTSGVTLERIDQRPLRFIGREHRSIDNWWLISRLV
jgi:Methyltransferase FkbM domain